MAESREDEQLNGRLVAVAVLGFVLIVPPLLPQFDRMGQVLGVPVLAAYLFLAWAVLVVLVALVAGTGGRSSRR
ncbi:hypothetical protein [Streptomyces sp. WMMB 322]|uniref:hypothetical protein n=1 Tax=Streptomyces sp. WMMB 322 TaxID=1286821 RepID=UPI0006E15591|nr:hypothetical protein [Streptomyces sp. WMMB 322]SCK08826.1 hypothetical protein H180DRAFT_00408 [Streptomyces sp. WMMB 322]